MQGERVKAAHKNKEEGGGQVGGLGMWGLGEEDVADERQGRVSMANRSSSSGEAG